MNRDVAIVRRSGALSPAGYTVITTFMVRTLDQVTTAIRATVTTGGHSGGNAAAPDGALSSRLACGFQSTADTSSNGGASANELSRDQPHSPSHDEGVNDHVRPGSISGVYGSTISGESIPDEAEVTGLSSVRCTAAAGVAVACP